MAVQAHEFKFAAAVVFCRESVFGYW